MSTPTKQDATVSAIPVTRDGSSSDTAPELEGPSPRYDAEDMIRLGKKQEYNRNFRLLATIGFSAVYSSTWEYVLLSTSGGLINGGFAGLFWQYVWTSVGAGAVFVSLAEMTSMAPTAGGQYHWVSEFAPPRLQRILSYISGWTSCIAWQPSLAGGLYPAVTMLGAMRTYWDPNFAFANWQQSLLMIGMSLVAVPVNTFWRKYLPAFESIILALHFLAFLIIVIAVWSLSPNRNSPSDVFVNVVNSGGWSSNGLAMLVGQVSTFYTLAGADSAVHMCEEVVDAAITVPRALVYGYLLNTVMGFVMLITLLFCIGDLNDAIQTAEPFVNLFTSVGPAAATGLSALVFIILVCGNSTALTSESRQLWAFARDNGLPFSRWLSKIDKRTNVPINTIIVSLVINTALCLINLGSQFAFNIIIGISSAGILSTYFISIGSLISARIIRPETLPPARWSLGIFGLPINIVAVIWAGMVLVFCFFPTEVPVAPDTMNWTVVIFGAVVIISTVFFVTQGRKYQGPVAYTSAKRQGNVIQTVEGDVVLQTVSYDLFESAKAGR